MRYLAAYLLLIQGENAAPTLKDLQEVIESVGVEFEASRAEALLQSLEGKTIQELIAEGSAKFGSRPSGGAAASSGGAGAAGGASEEAAEEEAAEEEEESDDDMGFGLFD